MSLIAAFKVFVIVVTRSKFCNWV